MGKAKKEGGTFFCWYLRLRRRLPDVYESNIEDKIGPLAEPSHKIPKAIQKKIVLKIDEIEKEHNVSILFAVESGSRAWGSPSPDSDFDVRFIYVHKEDWYLSIDSGIQRDVIEYPIDDESDISGWDIRKGLNLFSKSNPSFLEWLHSPIVYKDDQMFAPACREVLPTVLSKERLIYHYLGIAKKITKSFLQKTGCL